jgi:hemolysin activation/secretion protein
MTSSNFKKPWNLLLLIYLSSFALKPSLVVAQVTPPRIDLNETPSRIEQQLDIPAPPSTDPDVTIPGSPDLTPPDQAEELTFIFNELNIQGATVYDAADLNLFYEDKLGEEISLRELYNIANSINRKYQDDGYVFTRILVPEQTIENGIVRLEVIEGFIENVTYQGNIPERQFPVLHGFGEKLISSKPLNIEQLERYLLLANDLAGFKVRGNLERGESRGGINLILSAEFDEMDGFLSLNNRGTASIGDNRLQIGGLFNSPFGRGDRFVLSGAIVPEDWEELNNIAASYTIPIGYEGLSFNVQGGVTAIRPQDKLKDLDINGSTVSFSTGLSYSLIRSRNDNVSLRFAFDYLDEEITSLAIDPGNEFFFSEDRLRVLRFGVNSNHSDNGGITYTGGVLSLGLDALGAKAQGTFDRPLSRENGNVSFTKFNFNLGRQQYLPEGFSLALEATGQITSTALLASEQFGIGGAQFGRAFDPAIILGDSGYSLRAELQKGFFYEVGQSNKLWITQPYIFFDYGQGFRLFPSAVESGTSTLASTGLGIRQNLTDGLLLNLQLAFPVVEDNLPRTTGNRLFFELEGFF